MRSVLTPLAAGLALIFTFTSVSASETVAHGDAEAGKTKSAVCVSCHMADGNTLLPNYPSITGQQPGYIAAQLAAFKEGARADDTMRGMVAALSEQDMLDLDAYFSSLAPKVGEITQEQETAAREGEAIYRAGLAKFSVTSCMACHGPDGKGVQPQFPRLAGQNAAYIENQLLAFKNGSRQVPMMNDIAFPLSEAQIKNLALYISGLY